MKDVILIFPRHDFVPDGEYAQRAAAIAPGYQAVLAAEEPAADLYERAVICYGGPSAEQLRRMPRLKWLQLPFAGAERFVDKSLYCNEDIIVTNSSGVFGMPIAEYALCTMLMLSRNMHLYRDQQRAHVWKSYAAATDFYGSRVLIVGLGDIGANLAVRAKALGAHVVGIKRTPYPKPDCVDELYGMDALESQLPSADFVALCLPGTPLTRGIMNKRRLDMMKSSAILVNVGRGSAIVKEDLMAALSEGRLKACALDVTDPEPLPADDPLWDIDNIFITPHCSGGSPTDHVRAFDIFLRNLEAFVGKKPMMNIVDFSEGY